VKILLVNKYLYSRAGAETALLHTRDLLLANGHEVIDFAMTHPENLPSRYERFFAPARSYDAEGSTGVVKRVRDGAASIYSVGARRALVRLLDTVRPDVAHLHNIYHQLTFSIVDELASRGIPMVQTIHDWKIACPAYTLFTEGAPCRRCPESSVLAAVRHRCVKDSVLGSSIAAVEAAVAHTRGSYHRVSTYIAPSDFARSVVMLAGIPGDQVRRLTYLFPRDELAPVSEQARGPVFFHAGRLDETKGVRQLLAAFAAAPQTARLEVAGWGALEDEVRAAAARDDRITFHGRLPRETVLERLSHSRALLLPSIWEDNCPLIMLEAQARSTPAIVSDRGGPREFVRDREHGFVIDPEDTAAFTQRIADMTADAETAAAMGARGHQRLLAEHDPDRHYRDLMAIYNDARQVAD
jgi:glycosyltransferase involved in cell wall biosynthesis